VWAIFAPAWIARLFRFALDHFLLALAGLLCVLVGMLAFTLLA